jgi:GTP-sensing pleiotropic transcriptional regulator CodY
MILSAQQATLPKNLDNYTAVFRSLNPERLTISDNAFVRNNWVTDFNTAGLTYPYSIINDLGFTIEINNLKYSTFSITSAGYIFLRDNNGSTTANFYKDVIEYDPDFDGLRSTTNIDSSDLILSTFLHNHILIAPWFTRNISQLGGTVKSLSNGPYSSIINSTVEKNIVEGRDKRFWPFDGYDTGTRWKKSYDKQRGKCIICRWTVSQRHFRQKFKFQTSVFENGEIEFLYWPLDDRKYVVSNVSTFLPFRATSGIFWSSPANGANKFRDVTTFFGYAPNRTLNPLGGTSFYGNFLDGPGTYKSKYASAMEENYWPKNGAIINFLPPNNTLKSLPRKSITTLDSNTNIVPTKGMFDDRKSIVYADAEIDFPSTLSRFQLNGVNSEDLVDQQKYISPFGINVKSRIVKDSIDSLSKLVKSSVKISNNQFNDSATNNDSVFYATGSSLEQFGEGFNQRLSSKNQVKLTLPIQKSIQMPVSESCFYYYDSKNKTWSLVASTSTQEIPYTAVSNTTDNSIYSGENTYFYYNTITETSIGFDAVGRKIVSGNLRKDFVYDGQQESYGIGAPINTKMQEGVQNTYANIDNFKQYEKDPGAGKQLIENCLSQKYHNSITDSFRFSPENNSLLDLNLDYPFLIEKLVIEFPISVSGSWFNDITTTNKARIVPSFDAEHTFYYNRMAGPIDFGGPGLTFAIHCPKKNGNKVYLDLIASGTITHHLDNKSSIVFRQLPSSTDDTYIAKNEGFLSFGTPSTVIQGVWNGSEYIYEGNVKLEITPSVSSGVMIARNIVHSDYSSDTRIKQEFSREELFTLGSETEGYGFGDGLGPEYYEVPWRNRRNVAIYLQQISPYSRGTSEFSVSGQSILGYGLSNFTLKQKIKNPLFLDSDENKFPDEIKDAIVDMTSFSGKLEVINFYSYHESKNSPYLIFPGEKLAISISKTRPVIDKMFYYTGGEDDEDIYGDYILTGSHSSVILTTGSINITVYGSYVSEGSGYNL